MNLFRVYIVQANGLSHVEKINAETPNEAAKNVRKDYPGCIVIKVKRANH